MQARARSRHRLRDLAGTIERLFHARLEIRIDRAVRKGLVEALARLAIYDDSTANVRTSLDKLVKRGLCPCRQAAARSCDRGKP